MLLRRAWTWHRSMDRSTCASKIDRPGCDQGHDRSMNRSMDRALIERQPILIDRRVQPREQWGPPKNGGSRQTRFNSRATNRGGAAARRGWPSKQGQSRIRDGARGTDRIRCEMKFDSEICWLERKRWSTRGERGLGTERQRRPMGAWHGGRGGARGGWVKCLIKVQRRAVVPR